MRPLFLSSTSAATRNEVTVTMKHWNSTRKMGHAKSQNLLKQLSKTIFYFSKDFNVVQTVQGPKVSFSGVQTVQRALKRHQTMNKGLIKWNDRSFNKLITKFKFYKLKCSPRSVLWREFVTLLFVKMNESFSESFGSLNERHERIDSFWHGGELISSERFFKSDLLL